MGRCRRPSSDTFRPTAAKIPVSDARRDPSDAGRRPAAGADGQLSGRRSRRRSIRSTACSRRRSTAFCVVGCRRRRALSDLVQDTFLQIHRARHTYDPAYPVGAVGVCDCAPRVADALPRDRRRPQRHRDDRRRAARRYAPRPRRSPIATLVRDALAHVSPERRRPLVWHHVLGLSFREIAARLGIREDAAKLRSSRGMADLRAELDEQGRTSEGSDDE